MSGKYIQLSPREHVLQRPNMYIGSISNENIEEHIYFNNRIIKKDITFNPGLFKIIDEAIANAVDMTIKDSTCRNIAFNYDNETGEITVFNDGNDGIEIMECSNDSKIFIPEFIFSRFNTSSNYQNETLGVIGTNGIGIKATNCFSKQFIIDIVDSRVNKRYVQVFKNNMSEILPPQITKSLKKSYCCLKFIPDYARFGVENLNLDMQNFIKKRMYDIAFTSTSAINGKLKIIFNKSLISVKSFNDYINLYYPEDSKAEIFTEAINDNWRIGVVYVPNKINGFESVSFVNNSITLEGGSHVNIILNQILTGLMKYATDTYKTLNIRESYFKDNMTLFVDCKVKTPKFDSQSKNKLKNVFKVSDCPVSAGFIKKIIKSGIIKSAVEFATLKQQHELKKTDGKKTRKVEIEKYRPAKYAGTNKSNKCWLIITEGDSAKTFALHGLKIIGHDYYGVFPIRGKMLNTRDATNNQIINNVEIKNIKQILGIKSGITYNELNINTLNYGGILILTDQDLDGSHIKGLIINFIDTFWPELAQIPGFFKTLNTPIIKAIHKTTKEKIVFYSKRKYDLWEQSITDLNKWKIKYYKGLGTSTEKEALECFEDFNQKLLSFIWDSESENSLNLAFAKSHVTQRKEWLKNYNADLYYDPVNNNIPYSEFINKDLIHFSNYDNIRSIPQLIDGLKPSQRKVLFTALSKKYIKADSEIKVSNLASVCSDLTCYLHGEVSLIGTIINMAQDFTGSNNLNLFFPDGNFGSRRLGGSDASAARYIFTYLMPYVQKIFRPEDNPILEFNYEDNIKVEPKSYYPIIPMVLINGAQGIGTGFSTNIPTFNPLQIIDNLINSDFQMTLKPYFRGFTGCIESNGDNKWTSYGKFTVSKNKVTISELPIGVWTDSYVESLQQGNNPLIKNIDNFSNPNDINIIVTLTEVLPNDQIIKLLKLTSTINLNNMILHNTQNQLAKYETINEIMTEFIKKRLEIYDLRREYWIKKLKQEMLILENKVRFIKDIIDEKIIINKQKKADIIQRLIDLKYSPFSETSEEPNFNYLINMQLLTLTYEQIERLNKEYEQKKSEYSNYLNMTSRDLWIKELKELRHELGLISPN